MIGLIDGEIFLHQSASLIVTARTGLRNLVASHMNGMPQQASPWVIVAGGFHELGGMDKANAALARYLLSQNIPVHLVAHKIAEDLSESATRSYVVERPFNSFLLGERALDVVGRRVARAVTAEFPGARIVVNGGNCLWHDVNWVHSVHHAWPTILANSTPLWFRGKERVSKFTSRAREKRAITKSRLVIANSERTRQDVMRCFKLDSSRIVRIYLGADPTRKNVTPEERERARAWLNLSATRKVMSFVGALGHDQNKGLETIWSAWHDLCSSTKDWNVDLVIAGGGRGVESWRARVKRSGFEARVRVLGFTDRIQDVLAASDLLVSPVKYEAFGLNVHESICRGIPAMVTSSAGIAELYSADCAPMLLNAPPDVGDLRGKLMSWNKRVPHWKAAFEDLGSRIRLYTWRDMAADLVAAATGPELSRRVEVNISNKQSAVRWSL
jgi:hypothetical protein